MSLSEKRCLFTYMLAVLVKWARDTHQISLAFDEGLVAHTDATDGDYDGPHKKGGAHYTGLGMDTVMYRRQPPEGKLLPVESGDDPAWLLVGEHWESFGPEFFWGGRIRDANHFSLRHEGRA